MNEKKAEMDRIFHPWFAASDSVCSNLYRTFYLHGNHVLYKVYNIDASYERHQFY